ncbi:MAG: LCP family protein [Lachnospiraceae bacterium]|nr:LCP family protein [Lachnospiraceae bacterium]
MSKRKKKMSTTAKWAIAFLVELAVLITMVVGYFVYWTNSKLGNIQHVEIQVENVDINEGANEAQKGYTTIALFGIDARSNTSMAEGNRTDAIMIASINNDTKEVKIVSVYRDTLLEIRDGSSITSKVNAAYSYGGPELALKTLNANLDLEITEFVTVNFLALTKAVDDLGGIVINVKSSELPVLNSSIQEQIGVTGIYSDGVFTTGDLLLNGTQATAYARIRSTDRGDITRTERQREVIAKMVAKAKKSDLSTIEDIIDDVFPNVYTSLERKEIISLASSLFSYSMGDTAGFPFVYVPISTDAKGAVLVPANLEANVSALHEFLFDTKDYDPSQTVKNISRQIENETGVAEQEINVEIFNPQ